MRGVPSFVCYVLGSSGGCFNLDDEQRRGGEGHSARIFVSSGTTIWHLNSAAEPGTKRIM